MSRKELSSEKKKRKTANSNSAKRKKGKEKARKSDTTDGKTESESENNILFGDNDDEELEYKTRQDSPEEGDKVNLETDIRLPIPASTIITPVMRTTNIEKYLLTVLSLETVAKLVDNRKRLQNNDVTGKVSDQIHGTLFLTLLYEFRMHLSDPEMAVEDLIDWMDGNEEEFIKHLIHAIVPPVELHRS